MAQGNYDHASYLTRQSIYLGKTTAGANGTSQLAVLPNNMRLRNAIAVVNTAGAGATTGSQIIVGVVGTCTQFGITGVGTVGTGTTTLGAIVLGTSTANSFATSGDLNVCINAGSVVYLKNGTDTAAVGSVTLEAHVDPLGSWVGGNV